MSKYFKYFPLQQYDYYGDGVKSSIVDIYRMVAVDSIKIDDIVSYTYHEIKNGERPDVTSQMLYGTPDYHWTFFVLNPFLRAGMGAWYKDDHVMEKYLAQKYDPYFGMEFKLEQTGPIDITAEIPIVDETGNASTVTETISALEVKGTLAGLDYSGITLGLSVVTDGYSGHVFPIVESDANRMQLTFRRDGITKVEVVDGGKDYIIGPTLSVVSASGFGTGAKIEAVLNRGSISSVRIADQGYGYTHDSYQVLVKNTPVEDAKLVGTVDGSGHVNLSFLPRPEFGVGSPSLNDSEVNYRGKGYVKRPLVVVSPPDGGGTTAVFEVSVDRNTGRLSTTTSSGVESISYRVINPGSGYALGERVYIRLVNQDDSLLQLVAHAPSEEMLSSANLLNSHLQLTPINPYLSTEAGYASAQSAIDSWVTDIFYPWVVQYLQISYYTFWLSATPAQILADANLSLIPYKVWSSLRYAAHTYYDSAGKALTASEAQAISASVYDTFANHEIEINDSHRSIRIVRPENIMQFTEEYRKVLTK